jgi:hypothetical protein
MSAKIRERVRALIAKTAPGAGTTEEEARSSALIACRLIREHKLLDEPAAPAATATSASSYASASPPPGGDARRPRNPSDGCGLHGGGFNSECFMCQVLAGVSARRSAPSRVKICAKHNTMGAPGDACGFCLAEARNASVPHAYQPLCGCASCAAEEAAQERKRSDAARARTNPSQPTGRPGEQRIRRGCHEHGYYAAQCRACQQVAGERSKNNDIRLCAKHNVWRDEASAGMPCPFCEQERREATQPCKVCGEQAERSSDGRCAGCERARAEYEHRVRQDSSRSRPVDPGSYVHEKVKQAKDFGVVFDGIDFEFRDPSSHTVAGTERARGFASEFRTTPEEQDYFGTLYEQLRKAAEKKR